MNNFITLALDLLAFIAYTIRIESERLKIMKEKKLLKLPNGHVLECAHNAAIDPQYAPKPHVSGSWMRDEIAIIEGRKSFTPDVTMVKAPQSLGPIANSVVQDTI